MPVLRVALAEPDFFGTLNHPARQLIDRMGSCVMGFDASGIQGGALEKEIKRVVQVIEQYPETGKRVYQLVYDEFQKFLQKFLAGNGATQKVVSVAQQVEQKETLTIQYTIEMRNMLKDMPVRDEIRSFLFKVWAEVLAVAAVRNGPQHAEDPGAQEVRHRPGLGRQRQAQPPTAPRDPGPAQAAAAPARGMTLLGHGAQPAGHAHQDGQRHAGRRLPVQDRRPFRRPRSTPWPSGWPTWKTFVSEDGMGDLPLDAESIELMLGIDSARSMWWPTAAPSRPAMLAWAQELQLGVLVHAGPQRQDVNQVQFAWRSERKQLHLFASTDGHSYLIQAGRLAAYLQAGLLLPQEEEALTVRATRDALAKLEANPERLLG
jgi:hypothetical protein